MRWKGGYSALVSFGLWPVLYLTIALCPGRGGSNLKRRGTRYPGAFKGPGSAGLEDDSGTGRVGAVSRI